MRGVGNGLLIRERNHNIENGGLCDECSWAFGFCGSFRHTF